eukprot:RCo008591
MDSRMKKVPPHSTVAGSKRKAAELEASLAAAEQAKYRASLEDADAETMKALREESRRKYLEKRVDKVVDQTQKLYQEEQKAYPAHILTSGELIDRERDGRVLELAKEYQKLSEEKEEHYHIPDAYVDEVKQRIDRKKKESVLYQRYGDDKRGGEHGKDEFSPLGEQRVWESQRLEQALKGVHFGAANKKELEPIPEYELLLEDQIEFVAQEILEGKREPPMSQAEVEARQQRERELAAMGEKERIQAVRRSLPIYALKEDLMKAIHDHQVLIMVGETGSGKTTQITQYLHEAGYTKDGMKVACTQPRRVAAMSVAARVAVEMDQKLGRECGYRIRFEDCTSEKTVIVYMTDGMMLREFLTEPDLGGYSVIIVDEAHERSLHTDVVFGLVKDVARFRKDLKLIVSSATLEAEKFSQYFDSAPVFRIPGRKYNVDIMHTKAPEADYVAACVVCVFQIHLNEPPGDILIFLTGQEEIEECSETIRERMRGMGSKMVELIVLPIYSTLPSEQQARIFEPAPPGARKVIVATNIAETSLTIDGIVYVVDAGFCKMNAYNPRSGLESLVVVPISKANAIQRAGRAGRTQPGKCYRIYTKWSYEHELDDVVVPEIQRTNLGAVVLLLKTIGIHDLVHFDFIDAPAAETLIKALEQLYALGALNDKGELTKLGRRMAEFPLDPQLSKTLIAAGTYHCTDQVASVCALLSVNNSVFYMPKDKKVQAENARRNFFRGGGDHLALLNVWEEFEGSEYSTAWCYENFIQYRNMRRAREIRDQLTNMMERVDLKLERTEDLDNIKKAIVAGYFFHTATLNKDGKSYRTIRSGSANTTVYLHPLSFLYRKPQRTDLPSAGMSGGPKPLNEEGGQPPPPKWLVYHELVLTSKEYMRQALEIQPKWLIEVAPHYYKSKDLEEIDKKLPKMRKVSNQAPPDST